MSDNTPPEKKEDPQNTSSVTAIDLISQMRLQRWSRGLQGIQNQSYAFISIAKPNE